MMSIDKLQEYWNRTTTGLKQNEWIPTLLMRLFVGGFFFETGLAKVQNLDAMTQWWRLQLLRAVANGKCLAVSEHAVI